MRKRRKARGGRGRGKRSLKETGWASPVKVAQTQARGRRKRKGAGWDLEGSWGGGGRRRIGRPGMRQQRGRLEGQLRPCWAGLFGLPESLSHRSPADALRPASQRAGSGGARNSAASDWARAPPRSARQAGGRGRQSGQPGSNPASPLPAGALAPFLFRLARPAGARDGRARRENDKQCTKRATHGWRMEDGGCGHGRCRWMQVKGKSRVRTSR